MYDFFFFVLSQFTYAEIEYYFFYLFIYISEAIVLYLLECKTTVIWDNPPKKTCLPRENVFIQEMKIC